jgi:hypothetical protein
MIFLSMQVDEYGAPLTDGYLGVKICLLAAAATCVFNLFRGMQVCVYGEDF